MSDLERLFKEAVKEWLNERGDYLIAHGLTGDSLRGCTCPPGTEWSCGATTCGRRDAYITTGGTFPKVSA